MFRSSFEKLDSFDLNVENQNNSKYCKFVRYDDDNIHSACYDGRRIKLSNMSPHKYSSCFDIAALPVPSEELLQGLSAMINWPKSVRNGNDVLIWWLIKKHSFAV